MSDREVFFEAHDCFEEGMTVAIQPDGSVVFKVAEDQAVDSYNRSFTCTYTMKPADVARLCALLNGGQL